MQDGMHILYQFNEKYAPYAGVSLTSLFENNKAAKSIYIYILGEGLSKDSIGRLNKLAVAYNREVIFVPTDELIEQMKELNMPTYRGSYAANMRLFVADVAKDADRLLYLDADTIVTGDITSLFEMDIKTVGMVYDTLGCVHKYDIGLSSDDGYYNSGVIVYDLKKWRDNKITDRIISHVQNVRAQYPSPDQDLLNVCLKGEITSLPFEYNFQPHLREYSYKLFTKVFKPYPFYSQEQVEKAQKEPVIMHAFRYIGAFPWHEGSRHPFCDEFDKYMLMSLWADYIKEKKDTGIAIWVEELLHKVMPKAVFLRLFKIMHRAFFVKADKLSRNQKISKQM